MKLRSPNFALNSAQNYSTEYSLHELIFSYTARLPSDAIFDTTSTQFYSSKAHLKRETYYHFRSVFDLVRRNISGALTLQKRIYDRQANYTRYSVGDLVLVYKPIPQSIRNYRKFLNPFQGPCRIVQIISEHNLLIENCQTGRKEVVHFDLLRLIKKKVTRILSAMLS